MEFENPVLPGTHPDPSVCRVGEQFYLAVSSFEYFPGVPLFRSTDLVCWERIGHCLTRESQVDLSDRAASEGIFAPTLRHYDGTFYVITTDVGGDGHFYVTAEDPTGEWSEPVFVDAGGIDPDLFVAEDGTAYFQYTDGETLADFRIRQGEIDLETGELGDAREIWAGERGGFAEAPHLYEIDGTYYLLAAEGGTHTNHMVTVGRSDEPTGPFERCPHNPILTHHGLVSHPIAATGHGDLVQGPDGTWWIVFLAIRQQGGHPGWHHLGREAFLAPVTWEDGWPVVNGGEPVDLAVGVDSVPGDPSFEPSEPARAFETDFEGDSLDAGWFYRRNPESGQVSPDDRSSHLTLSGATDSLSDRDATFVGRPQTHLDCNARVDLDWDPEPGEEAGLALVTNEEHHYEVGVAGGEDGQVVLVRLQVGDLTDVVAEESVDGTTHALTIEATCDEYRFGCDGVDLASAATKYLATEVAGGFTGVYLGPYALSGGVENATPAHVDRFVSEPSP